MLFLSEKKNPSSMQQARRRWINSSNDKSENEFDINKHENAMDLSFFWLQIRGKNGYRKTKAWAGECLVDSRQKLPLYKENKASSVNQNGKLISQSVTETQERKIRNRCTDQVHLDRNAHRLEMDNIGME